MLPIRKILCPTDFSEPSYEGLRVADELALHFSAELCVVHVVPPVPVVAGPLGGTAFNVPAYQQELVASSKKSLDGVVEQRISKELPVRPIVVQGNAADEIVRIADEEKAGLIVMATHGQTGWRHLVFGSVAERVVRVAACPVLTVQVPQDQGE